jgi:hypothetical protein
VAAAEWILYAGKQTCGECHEYEGAEAGVAPEASASPVPAAIVPPAVPAVWFPHAIFRHTAHRALACEACHAGARESQAGTDVLLPGIDTCLRCHAPGAGARSDCAECHRYHGGDQPLHGPGAPGRDGRREFEIPAFLSGPSKADKG